MINVLFYAKNNLLREIFLELVNVSENNHGYP